MSTEPARPLARSLDPLSGESLNGFLLRLSYRLGIAPHRVATLSGLTCRSDVIPHDQLRGLAPGAAVRFAKAAHLTVFEAHALTLKAYTHVYPPLAKLRTAVSSSTGKSQINWATNPESRYCSRCLAGDASPVQMAYGGPWQLRWHLPVVFACTQHRRLLQQHCPRCSQPLTGHVARRHSVLTSTHVSGLHPAQCRNQDPAVARRYHGRVTPCGGWLNQPSSSTSTLAQQDVDELLWLQEHLDRHLTPQPVDRHDHDSREHSESYFNDLILTAKLILLSWPHGAALLPSSSLADLVDQSLSTPQRPGTTSAEFRAGRLAPSSPTHSGALLLAAARALGDRDVTTMRDRIAPLTREVYRRSRSTGGKLFAGSDASIALLRATAPRVYGLQERPALRITPSRHRYRLDEIPPLFPRQWYAAYLEPLTVSFATVTTTLERHLRWAGSLRLAELITGRKWRTCASSLGIPPSSAVRTMNVLGQQMADAGLWPAFEDAVDEAARRLDDHAHRTDYANRRRTMADWRLSRDQWRDLCSGIPGLEQRAATGDPCVGEALIWSMVNEASYLHSPTVLHRRSASSAPTRITCQAGALLRRQRPSFMILRRRLEAHASVLAQLCDRGGLHIDVAPLDSIAFASGSHQIVAR
ncbi:MULTISPECIES: TniQ family protein [Streptomyces]|uniref:TniQ family protein n=1 Tax=Streptomyces TaxID=1883 RepID=UPI001318E4AC|nr:TniQ family protein [Streptomyces sp. QHH-9511]QGZ47450.1 hypothetical protein GPZ77_02695 [Streptomyces sp. QHH-9511]